MGRTDLPAVAVLSTGGTIASRVDYQTGAVNPALSAEDLYNSVPELKKHANIRAKVVMSRFSENIHPADWTTIASAVASEIRKDVAGVVIAHGTDTMGFTAAALSFSLQNLPVPVAMVGSQRSSDRPSSDASMNLIAATDLVAHADAAEVMVVMHGGTDDRLVHAHRGNRVRKLHTSRRDAFQSVNYGVLYGIDSSGITELNVPLLRRNRSRKMRVRSKFDDQAVLLKTFPGMRDDLIQSVIDHGYKGIVLEGSGLGHTPTVILQALKSAIDAGMVVAMTSQCIWGRVNMNVYRTGVELTEIGVVPCEDMLPETALVKLMWLLANSKDSEEVRRDLPVSLVGEIDTRTRMTPPTPCGGRFPDERY
jgi:glutamyl-tRNA(Gln) amidotransferase subunit D